MPSKKKSVARSFRVAEDSLKVLYEEAEKVGISPNTLLNQILLDYSNFYRFSKRFGIVNISYPTMSKFVECCSKEKLVEIAHYTASTTIKDGIRTLGFSVNYGTLVYFVEYIFGGLAGWFECNHHLKNGKEIFHLRHNLGDKWSVYVAEVISYMFLHYLDEKFEVEFLEGSVTLTRKRKNSLVG